MILLVLAIGGAGLLQLQQNAKVVVTKISTLPTPAVTPPVTAAAHSTQPSGIGLLLHIRNYCLGIN